MEEPPPAMPETLAAAPSAAAPSAAITDDATERMGISRNYGTLKDLSARAKQTCASAFQDLVIFIKSPTGERFVVLEIFILTAMTLLLFLLYQKEMKKRADFQKGMDMIRSFVVGIDPIYTDLDDFQILAVAQNLSKEVGSLAKKNDQLQKEIDMLSKNINDGWILFANAYYWFSYDRQSWMNSQRKCEKEGAKFLSVETAAEQTFIYQYVTSHRKNYWIGLYKDKQMKWKWVPDMIPKYHYWRRGEPRNNEKNHCGYMSYHCNRGCWATTNCEQIAQYICKKVPNDAWL